MVNSNPVDTISVCPVCGEPTAKKVTFGDKSFSMPLACACARAQAREMDEYVEREKKLFRDKEIIRGGYLDESYLDLDFGKDDSPTSKPSMDLRRYVKAWDEMKKKNIGLLLMGSYGTGKTYYAGAIANEVRKLGDYVLIGTLPKLISTMNEDYGRYKSEWEDKIKTYPLMVIDDLGIERITDYSYEQIETIIDLRYRSKLPIIVTTNISKTDLANMTDIRQQRVWSRLNEMCVAYAITGTDRRVAIGKQKREEAKAILGI